ncbi:MAG: DUF5602 domain-containing protein [Bacteroidetes bacterium]|nr:DUF5602 domain-containing protein [Bacteroidota bacterium]
MRKVYIIMMAGIVSLASCKKSDNNASGTFNGADVKMGNGKAYAWTKTDDKGNPVAVGMTLSEDALQGLDTNAMGMDNEFELSLPSQAAKTIFKHFVIDWNPHGHPPAGIYTVPHFDFHFYYISSAERKQIPEYTVDSNAFKNYPSTGYLPTGYINPGGGEAEMGSHWIDVSSPELHGQPFTQTFIYGSYNGKVTFEEPMVAYSYLKSITDYSRAIPQPSKVATSAYYPTTFHISHSNGVYTIALENMVYKTAN